MRNVILNEKGMTAVEVLVCFILVVVITVSMYTTVSTYKNKQQIEAFKEQIYTYKNLLSKDINDDIIKKGLVNADITEFNTAAADDSVNTYSVDMYLRDGSVKTLKIRSVKAYDYLWEDTLNPDLPADKDQDDFFMIWYGDKGKEIMYPIPDLGESKNPNDKVIKDFRINNVDIRIQDMVLIIYIGFYHPDLGNRYAIDIVCPINYSGLSEGGGTIEPSIPVIPDVTPDPTSPIIPTPSSTATATPSLTPTITPSPSPTATPSPSPTTTPSSTPTPGVDEVVSGTACERSGDNICWFTTSTITGNTFAEAVGFSSGSTNADFDLTVAWTRQSINWQCWNGANKGFGWWVNAEGFGGYFGGYRCWEGSSCYTYLKSIQSGSAPKSFKIGNITGTIQSCDCLWQESC